MDPTTKSPTIAPAYPYKYAFVEVKIETQTLVGQFPTQKAAPLTKMKDPIKEVPTHLTSLLYLFPNIPPINPATTQAAIVIHSTVTFAKVRINKARATPPPNPMTVVPQYKANFQAKKAPTNPTRIEAIISPTKA